MNRRLYRKWVLWLLPVLVARAFLPVGFMWSAGAAGLEVTFCPGQASALVRSLAADPAAQNGSHDAGHAAPASHAHHDNGRATLEPPCPFAIAAVAVVADVPYLAQAAPQAAAHVVSHRPSFLAGIGPDRADFIRGPPSLS